MVVDIDTGALMTRVETVYLCEEYKVFLITGQGSGNKVMILPFNQVPAEDLDAAKQNAEPFVDGKDAKSYSDSSSISLSLDNINSRLQAYDTLCHTTTSIAYGDLDEDVAARLKQGRSNEVSSGIKRILGVLKP